MQPFSKLCTLLFKYIYHQLGKLSYKIQHCTAEIKITALHCTPCAGSIPQHRKAAQSSSHILRKKMWQKAAAGQWMYTSKGVVSTQTCT